MADPQFIIRDRYGRIMGMDGWFLNPICFGPDRRSPATFATEAEAAADVEKRAAEAPHLRLRMEAST